MAHMIVNAGKSRICSVGQQASDPGEPVVQMKSKAVCCGDYPLLGQPICFVLFRPSTN